MSNLGIAELSVISLIVVIFAVLIIIPYRRIFLKAGFSPWLSLLMLVPLVNLGMLYFLGFAEWPSLQK
jgi:hypothetical protein